MNNVIFGSGIVGCLAKFVLGDDWTIVPFGRSRFYSYSPPLADNHIIGDDQVDGLMARLGLSPTRVWYQRAYSAGGQIIKEHMAGLTEDWLTKTFGGDQPAHAAAYLKSRAGFFVYSGVRVNKLYQALQNRYHDDLKAEAAKGQVSEIGDHYFIRGGIKQEFDRAVTTIPLGALQRLAGREVSARCRPIQYVHLHTSHLDFEGANQALVVDRLFSFFQVTEVAPSRYVFQCHEDVPNPGAYFMPILKDYDLIDGTTVPDALPVGDLPNLDWVEAMGMYPVGQYAQHDWCADVGSNALRLLRYADRGYKRSEPRVVAL